MEPLDASKATDFWLGFLFICLTTLLSALLAPSQPTASTIGAGVLWLSLWHCYCVFFWGFGGKKMEKKRKAVSARGHFGSLIGDLTVGRLQLFERHGIFSEVTSGCCVSQCLGTKNKKKKERKGEKKLLLLPKVQRSHIC